MMTKNTEVTSANQRNRRRVCAYIAVIVLQGLVWGMPQSIETVGVVDWLGLLALPLYIMVSFTLLENQRYYWALVLVLPVAYLGGAVIFVTMLQPALPSDFNSTGIPLVFIGLSVFSDVVTFAYLIAALGASYREKTKLTLWLNRGIGFVYFASHLLTSLFATIPLLFTLFE